MLYHTTPAAFGSVKINIKQILKISSLGMSIRGPNFGFLVQFAHGHARQKKGGLQLGG